MNNYSITILKQFLITFIRTYFSYNYLFLSTYFTRELEIFIDIFI